MLIAVELYSGNGFHKWHNSHLTPHMLGVALNLHESNLLCNFIVESCETYHRHPPLYFYLNYAFAALSSSSEQYVRSAMTFSIVMNYIGVFIIMGVLGSDNRERILILAIFSTSILFLANLTLSNYESLFLLTFAAYAYSLKFNKRSFGYLAVFLGSVLSWFTVLASFIYVLFQLRRQDYWVVVPFFGGILFTVCYLFLGIDQFADNFAGVAKNIELSGSIEDDRKYGYGEVARMLVGTIKHLVFPSLFIILIGWLGCSRDELRGGRNVTVGILPVLVVCVWNVVFFSWSVVHNFIYIVLLIPVAWLSVEIFRTFSIKVQRMALLGMVFIAPYQYYEVEAGYHPLENYNNIGVTILKEAINNYGGFDYKR